MDSFEQFIGRNVNEISLNESTNFFLATIKYNNKLCDIDYFNLISFSELFKHEKLVIIWYDEYQIVTDLEIYYLSNDFDVLFTDYYKIKKTIDNGLAHQLTEGDTRYLGASRLDEKVPQPNSDRLANKREFVLKKKYLQKIINEIEY